jgi:hypothetical protein
MFINKAILRGYKTPRKHGVNEPLPTFTVMLHADGSVIRGLGISDFPPERLGGPRDLSVLPAEHRKGSLGNLISPGGVEFITRAGKKWFIKFTEFSFVVNGRETDGSHDPKPQRKVYESPKADHDQPESLKEAA